jgi:hypothetical protein
MRICISCGRRPHEVSLRKLPLAMSPDLGICAYCDDRLTRRGVKSGVQSEADRMLSQHKEAFYPYRPKTLCKHCGETPLLYDTKGHTPLWCAACEKRRMQLATGVRT